MDRFPKDCWKKKCHRFHVWGMSIDDISCYCDELKKECYASNENFCHLICPLSGQPEEEK